MPRQRFYTVVMNDDDGATTSVAADNGNVGTEGWMSKEGSEKWWKEWGNVFNLV